MALRTCGICASKNDDNLRARFVAMFNPVRLRNYLAFALQYHDFFTRSDGFALLAGVNRVNQNVVYIVNEGPIVEHENYARRPLDVNLEIVDQIAFHQEYSIVAFSRYHLLIDAMTMNARDSTTKEIKTILNAFILQETTFRATWSAWLFRHNEDQDWRNGGAGEGDEIDNDEILERSLAHLPTFSYNKYDNRFVIWELSDAWKKGG